LDPVTAYTKRLGADSGDRVQALLIGLQSPDEALSGMSPLPGGCVVPYGTLIPVAVWRLCQRTDASVLLTVASFTSRSKLLRQPSVESVRNNIFSNRNLTELEERLAYEGRCRRRLRWQLTSQ